MPKKKINVNVVIENIDLLSSKRGVLVGDDFDFLLGGSLLLLSFLPTFILILNIPIIVLSF